MFNVNQLKTVNFDRFIHFLQNIGWIVKVHGDSMTIRKTNGKKARIIPLTWNYDDSEVLLMEGIEFIAKQCNTNIDTVVNNINGFLIDKFELCISNENNGYPNLPFSENHDIQTGFKNLISSIALSVHSPSPYYIGKHPDQVSDFLSSIDISIRTSSKQNISAYYNANNDSRTVIALDHEASFSRRFTNKANEAIRTFAKTYSTYISSEDITIFDQTVSMGVSSNFCEAIKCINNVPHSKAVFTRKSARMPVKDEYVKHNIFNVRYNDLDRIIDYLNGKKTIPDYELIGNVIKLYKLEDHFTGEITVVSEIDDKMRRIKCVLPPEYYDIAILAHKERIDIFILGDLFITPKAANIYNIKSVTLS